MRLRPGDIVRYKESAYAVMWYPEMIGSIATVTNVRYGRIYTGEKDQIELEIHAEQSDWKIVRVWSADLWERVSE